MKNEMTAGAEHVLTHGTARTRAKAGGDGQGGPPSREGGASADSGAKKIQSIEITPDTKGGGRHIRHRHHPPHHKPEQDETYSVGDQQAMHDHLDEHIPEGGAEEAAGGAGEGQGGAEQEMAEEQMEHGAEGGGQGGAA